MNEQVFTENSKFPDFYVYKNFTTTLFEELATELFPDNMANFTNGTSNRTDPDDDPCFPPVPVGFNRYLMIVGFGCPIALFGFISNCILVRIFAQKSKRNTPTLYLLLLAIIDVWICLCYILLMGADAFALYHSIAALVYVWYQYLIPFFTISKIVQLACPYVIIFATIERYILSADRPKSFFLALTTDKARRCILVVMLIFSTLVEIPILWALEVVYAENCTSDPLGVVTVTPTVLTTFKIYQNYDYYFQPIVHTFFPISFLLLLNFGIVNNFRHRYRTRSRTPSSLRMRRTSTRARLEAHRPKLMEVDENETCENGSCCTGAASCEFIALNPMPNSCNENNSAHAADRSEQIQHLSPFAIGMSLNIFHERKARYRELREDRKRFREAGITLIAIVTSYLFCAFFSLFIRILERVEGHHLLFDEHGIPTEFYTFSTDLISFLVLFNSFLRTFIYYIANKEVRDDIKRVNIPLFQW